jgi:4-hydroxyphenylpyruvate dioxygenase
MQPTQLAINSVSTRQDNLEQALAAYAAAGFTNVEFVLSHPKEYLDQGHSVDDLRKLLDQHGLRCIGGFEGGVSCFGDPAANDAVIANARLLGDLGATALVVGTDGPAEGTTIEDPLGTMARVFADLGNRIKDTGVSICIEFNWSPIVKSLRTAAEIAERSGVENVGVLFDPAHYHCTPTKFDQINARTVPFIKHVHVNDMTDKPGELSNCNADRALPGAGHLDLPGIFGAIEQHGYRGYFSIEMFSDALWAKPVAEAAQMMYQSLLPLCESPTP